MKYENEIILEPDPSRVMEGLRDTGYNFNTAMADLIDNSIAAKAKNIKIKISMNPIGAVSVYLADDGYGMDLEGLKNAMRYGSNKRSDPSSLGKFGLGLKTASTAFCRSLSILSKTETSEYNKVCWDLDEICKINKWKLLTPSIENDEIDILEDVTNGGAGTLVIWNKVDRLIMYDYKQSGAKKKAFDRIISTLKIHLSRVFQRFISSEYSEDPISLYINDDKISPWDPFCKNEAKTQLVAKQEIPVEIGDDGKKAKFIVEAYILPRKEEFSSIEAYKNADIKNDTEGFYIYRENRLIYMGGWLDTYTSDPHFSLLRINFSFDHQLDDAFQIDIKKSRILLADEIFDFLKENFLPAPRNQANDQYRKGTSASIMAMGNSAHAASNANIESKASTVENSKISVEDKNVGTVKVSNSQGTFITTTIRIQDTIESGHSRVIPVPSIDSNMLWEPTIVDGNHAVSINQSHPYYIKVYAPVLQNHVLVEGMDALLWALAEAEISTYNEDTKEQYEDMRVQVSRILKKLVNDLPEPDVNE